MKRNQWMVVPEHGTPPQALLNQAYWAHVSAMLRRGDIITVLPDDNSYYSELLVLDVGKLFAKVVELRCVVIESSKSLSITLPEGYEIKFRGPIQKWTVLRGKEILKDGMLKQQAENWLSEHLQAFNKVA